MGSDNPFEDSGAINKLTSWAEKSAQYKEWLLKVLQSKQCHRILDVACGTGIDSLFLLEHGMEVVSCDDAEAMLSYARSEKERRGLKTWEIIKANWLTLTEDLPDNDKYDAVICVGANIFFLIDSSPELVLLRKCLINFKKFLKPGGLLLIDHRNMDSMLDRGIFLNRNVYHKDENLKEASIEVIEKDGVPQRILVSYTMIAKYDPTGTTKIDKAFPFAPVRVEKFKALLKDVFGANCKYALYGDFNLQEQADTENSVYFQHAIHE